LFGPSIDRADGHTFTLTTVIEVSEQTVEAEYDIQPPPPSLVNCDKAGGPDQYIRAALDTIKLRDSEMYHDLIQGRKVEIIPTSKQDTANLGRYPGIKYGQTHAGFIVQSQRIKIDTSLTVFSSDAKYLTCPIDIPLLLTIEGFEYEELSRAIRNDIFYEQENQGLQDIITKITAVFPQLGAELRAWCSIGIGNEDEKSQRIEQLRQLSEKGQLCYEGTYSEIEQMLRLPERIPIYIAADNLCEVPLYTKFKRSDSSSSIPSIRVENWYNGNRSTNDSTTLHRIRIEQYSITIAHEMGHIHYALNNIVEAYRWSLLKNAYRAQIFNSTVNTCYPGQRGDSSYCSTGEGHEHLNPDNFHTCGILNKYPVPALKE
jgi:hypothetical protein